jgi:NADH-quinone oxidoreductase subunit L
MIASVSIAGIPPFAGFWSKDEIVATTSNHPIFMVFTLLIAFMTAFYMWRLCFLTFWGKPRDEHRFEHAHESPKNMAYPLVFLAVLAVTAGWVGYPGLANGFASYVFHGEAYHPHANWILIIVSTLVGLAGITLAWLIYFKKVISADKLAEKFKPIYTLLYNKYYFDELYKYAITDPIMAFGRYMWSFDAKVIDGLVNGSAKFTIWWSDIKLWFDIWIIDGTVNGIGWVVRAWSGLLKYLQTGRMQFYAMFILTLVMVVVIYKFELVHVTADWPIVTMLFLVGMVILTVVTKVVQTKAERKAKNKE